MTSSARHVAAIDLGAGSGRVVLGRLTGDRAELEVIHRFENQPVWLPDGLHWNLPALFAETLSGLAAAAATAPLDSIGVDSWGCDYALLDRSGRMLGLPYHYRDARTSENVLARTHELVSRPELYRRTGIQTLPINTIFQLRAEAGGAAASVAERIALIPDLFALWLTGNLANELTIASTTGLLDAITSTWAADLISQLRLPLRPFSDQLVAPGFPIGSVLSGHAAAGSAAGTPVHAVAGHDTASAFAAAPITGPHCAILSSGTWSLLGLEVDEPRLSDEAARANFTNERGLGGTVRLLRNVMGMWLVEECRRAWARAGVELTVSDLQRLAAAAGPDVALFDPDDGSLLRPGGDMPQRITALCTAGGQAAPRGQGELVRSILVSLACKYRLVLESLEAVAGRRVEVIHVVGGGASNELHLQLTAEICGREVLAGPVEATALGNVLVQAMALGEVADLRQLRQVVTRSITSTRFEPARLEMGEETYQRFLVVSGGPAVQPLRTGAWGDRT
jgi:rhamnulokinase